MDGINNLCGVIQKAVKIAKSGGIAQSGVYNNGSVTVNGKVWTAEVIVPMTPYNGQKVFVQISAGDNKAYVIG